MGCDEACGRVPPVVYFPLRTGSTGGTPPHREPGLSGLAAVRIVAGLGLPVAVTLAWWKNRGGRESDGPVDGRVDVRTRPRPSRRELAEMIGGDDSLAYLDLSSRSIKRSDLSGRSLAEADATRADFTQSKLTGADLSDAKLDFADMSGCDMRGADFSGASLVETSLWNADLRGADLSSCKNIVMANLRRARYDRSTRWPPGFDPSSQGAVSDSQSGRR